MTADDRTTKLDEIAFALEVQGYRITKRRNALKDRTTGKFLTDDSGEIYTVQEDDVGKFNRFSKSEFTIVPVLVYTIIEDVCEKEQDDG